MMKTNCLHHCLGLLTLVGCTTQDDGKNSPAATSQPVSAVPFSVVEFDPANAGDVKAVGDFNNDGLPDVVVGGNANGEDMHWYEAPNWIKHKVADAVTEFSTDMDAGDVDKDGDLDLVVPDSDSLVWFENPMPGSNLSADLSWPKHAIGTLGGGVWIHDVQVADIDGDKKLDVVARQSTTRIFFQNSPSSWQQVDLPAEGKEGFALGDIDRDGDKDIIYGGRWYENPHNRTANWVERLIDSNPVTNELATATGDFNGDGRLDVVTCALHNRNNVSLWLAPPDPKAGGASWTLKIIATDMGSHKLGVADFNHDGWLDLQLGLENNGSGGEVALYLNGGAGESFTKQSLLVNGSSVSSHNARLIDIDNDGDMDIYAPQGYTGQLGQRIFRNETNPMNPTKFVHHTVTNNFPRKTFGLTFGDVDGDGKHDVLAGNQWFKNPGGDMLSEWLASQISSSLHDAILTYDVDGDSDLDVITMERGASLGSLTALNLRWYEYQRSNQAWQSVSIGNPGTGGDWPGSQGVTSADIDGDGREEILLSSDGGFGHITYFKVPTSNAELGNWPMVKVTADGDVSDEGVAVVDVDTDGLPDVLGLFGSDSSSDKIMWFKNPGNGAGNWVKNTLVDLTATKGGEYTWPDRIVTGDFDRDGFRDIVVTEEWGSPTSVSFVFFHPRVAGGNWTQRKILLANQTSTNSASVTDFDNDGDDDIVLASHAGNANDLKVQVFLNSGTGRFKEYVVATGYESHLGGKPYDLDRDGDLDIVSIAYNDWQNVQLWRNDANVGPGTAVDGGGSSDGSGSNGGGNQIDAGVGVSVDASSPVMDAGVVSADGNVTTSPDAATGGNGSYLVGKNTLGTSESSLDSYWLELYRFVAVKNGSVSRLHGYLVGSSGANEFSIALYASNNAGQPGLLKASCKVAAPVQGWNSCIVTGGAAVQVGAVYWLGVMAPGSGSIRYSFMGSGSETAYCMQGAASGPPASAPLGCSYSGSGQSAYAD